MRITYAHPSRLQLAIGICIERLAVDGEEPGESLLPRITAHGALRTALHHRRARSIFARDENHSAVRFKQRQALAAGSPSGHLNRAIGQGVVAVAIRLEFPSRHRAGFEPIPLGPVPIPTHVKHARSGGMVPGAIDKSPTSFHGARRAHGVEARAIVHQARRHSFRRGIKPIPCAPFMQPPALKLARRIGIIPGAAVISPAESHSARYAEAIRARTALRSTRGHNAGFGVEPVPIRAVKQPASLHCSRRVEETPAIIARNPARFHGTARNRSITARVQIVGLRSAFRKADGHDALVIKPIPKATYVQPSFDQGRILVVGPLIGNRIVFPVICRMRCPNRNRRISISF